MVHIIDASPERFFKDISDKKLLFFGAGKRAEYICEVYSIGDRVDAIIDNNSRVSGFFFEYKENKIPIYGIEYLINLVKKEGIEKIILLITPVFYGLSIIEQMDGIPVLNGLKCYLGRMLDDYYDKKEFHFAKGNRKIPAKIHYCWFGGKEIPSHLQAYIDTWKKKCPDYEIIRWDESNYDITKNKYMEEAYECKKWGFVPDYARLDIIYNEGGVYLDTDVELLSSLDCLLKDEVFFGFNSYGIIGPGLGFGAVPYNRFVKELRDAYENRSFYNDDKSENLTASSWYQYPVFKSYGFDINNTYQRKNNVVVYPSEVLAPTGAGGFADNFTDKTIAIHHAELSWVSEREKKEYERSREKIRERIKRQEE